MSNLNPPTDWLKELQDALWQIKMVNNASGILVDTLYTVVSQIQKWRVTIQAASAAITRFTALLNAGSIQRGLAHSLRLGRRGAISGARFLEGVAGRGGVIGRVAGAGARVLRGGAGMLGRGGMAVAGASTGAMIAGTVGIGAGLAAVRTAYKAWSERHQENLDRARKQASAASGVETRAILLQNKLNAELEKQSIRDIYAIEQKRAENAKALHMMKATNVASELRYQREIFAIEERRFENEKKINRLKMAVLQHEQKVQNLIGEQERIGEARASATIKRTWWRPDETVDANGNVISNSLAKAAGLRTLRARSTVDANFAAMQEIAKNVRNILISSFKEGADLFATRISSIFEKAAALSTDAMSPEMEKRLNDFKVRTDSFEARWVANMDKINYDKLMRGEFKPQQDKDGNYIFVDERGQYTAESREKFEKRRQKYARQEHNDIAYLERERQDLLQEGESINAQVEMSGRTSGVATERIKKELERRKEISEKRREAYISNTADVIGQYGDTGTAIQQRLFVRNRQLYQDYTLAGVEGDAETTQKMKQQFAMANAYQEAIDKAEEKAANERQELFVKDIVEAGRIQIRAADRQLQASLAHKEAQAELARTINKLQLDVELANADTYGKTVWETQKAINHANIDWKHQSNLVQINKVHRDREVEETKKLEDEKRLGMKEFDDGQINKRLDLEKQLVDAQLEYRMVEIKYEYAYREKMEEEYNRRRESKRKAWLQGVTKEEVKSLIGVDKEVSELTIDEQDRLAQTRKAQAEMADDLEGMQNVLGVSGQNRAQFEQTLDSQIQRYDEVSTQIGDVRRAVEEKRSHMGHLLEENQKVKILRQMAQEGLIDSDAFQEATTHGLSTDEAAAELGKKVQEEYNKRLSDRKPELDAERKEQLEESISRLLDEKLGENRDLVKYNAETGEVSLDDAKGSKAKQYKEALQWQTEHANEIERIRKYSEDLDNDVAAAQRADLFAREKSHLNEAIVARGDVYSKVEKEKADMTHLREQEEQKYDHRAKEAESKRKIDKENDIATEDLRQARITGYSDIGLSHAAKYDKFAAQQADIYNRGQIAQRNLATDTLISAMQQNGGGYTNQMIKYGIQSEYESAKNEMEARHAAEKEQLESRGNVTEYERQELQNRQAMEASDLDNDKKLRDMMADRVMNANVGQKSGLAETWERIQASAFGHMKDPVEMAIDSLKENDSKNHDDLMSRLDQYLPAIAQNTAESDATAVNQYNSYMAQPNANPGLLSGMPNVRMA